MYEEFKEINPDEKSRIEALTSGILSPDPKGIALLSMEEGKAYTEAELYKQVLEFLNSDWFPVTRSAVWRYCYGHPTRRIKGSLHGIGAVVELKIKPSPTSSKYVVAYQKTDAGADLGDPTVCIGTKLVNELDRMKIKYKSLWRIIGTPIKRKDAEYRRGYAVYEVIKLLAENRNSEFRHGDIIEELKELDDIVISSLLNELGYAGVISYESPQKDLEGKRARGWASYELIKKYIDFKDALAKIKERKRFYIPGYLKKITKYINEHPHEKYDRNKLSERLGISARDVSKILSSLKEVGYLDCKFSGRRSIAKANEATLVLWQGLEMIGKVAKTLDPYTDGFMDAKQEYEANPERWRKEMLNQLYIYDEERSHYGASGGEEIRKALLELPVGREFKLSQIKEIIEEKRGKRLTSRCILRHLKLMPDHFRKTSVGYYERIK